MLTIVGLVFAAAFAISLLTLISLSAKSSQDSKQIAARLDAIAGPPPPAGASEVADIIREDVLSDIPWLNELLHSFNIFPKLRKILNQANVDWKLGPFLVVSASLWALGAIAIFLRTEAVLISIAAGAVLATGPWLLVLHKRTKRFAEFEEKLPEALDLMVSAIRAGHGFASSIGLASREIGEPIAGEFRQCFDEQNFGLDLRVAMRNLEDRIPTSDVQLIVSAVLIQKESGGNLAEILEKVAYIIRERFRLKRQVRVHTAQGRLTGWILAILPIVLGFAIYLIDPPRMSLLWTHPTGIKLLWAAVIMESIGALIIRKIIRTPI